MRSVVMAVFAAAGLSLAAMPSALAGDRPTTKPSYTYSSNANYSSNARASAVAQARAEAGNMERKCVIMSCGTPWCYTVKR